ncbi:VOC family protein [Sphingomonas montanisoli]|uniref:VOC family protein n=1 Tax=Sphingomonas montanisoli TaxID=2606412 RepID=A0A5D9BZD0_9SPHN|nr:VOC family protein [Sphingomonas montanisoli]TZG24948.1 VOC family protein [Sphingomonas montanisoli]
MFSHVVLGANDVEKSKKFYDAIIGVTGGNPGFTDDKGRVIYMHNGGMLLITKPINGEPACHANGGTIGFKMDSTAQADAWHKAGTENGGTTCEDAPGIRDVGGTKMYLAYLRDPDGNKLCGMNIPG